jgi:DNA-binding transcriptional LysR family regulator
VATLDLNLVRVFVAIFETRSVTQAAARLDLTQPTVSHALGKLRDAYGDRLFIRGAKGLSPTALSEQLFQPLSASLATIESTLDQQQFDPPRSTRRFCFAMSDIGALYFMPPLLRRFQLVAPRIQTDIVELSESLSGDLSTGRVDFAIGNLPGLAATTRSQLLFREHHVCLLSSAHPSIAETMTIDQFAAARHILVASAASRHQFIEGVLSQQGISRNVAARVPQFTILPQLLAQSDLLVTLPSRVANLYVAQGGLKAVPLPVHLPDFEIRVHWHTRQDASPAHRWMLEQASETLSALPSPQPAA